MIYTSNIENSNLIITSNLENCLNSNNELIYEIQYDDNNSNILYEYEYNMKYVTIEGDILTSNQYDSNIHYKMAFVGCVYTCG